jgi:hypothetical protein
MTAAALNSHLKNGRPVSVEPLVAEEVGCLVFQQAISATTIVVLQPLCDRLSHATYSEHAQ